MRGALVGYGNIAVGHHEAYLEARDVDIVAVADPTEVRRTAASQRDRRISTYNSLVELLDAEDVDFVDICSPPSFHIDHQLLALAANCHVLCEKPFVLSLDAFRTLLTAHSKTSCLLYPSHNYKFSPIIGYLHKLAQSRSFGRIVSGHFRTERPHHALGVLDWRADWRRVMEYSGGGILQDHGHHSVYLACFVSNDTPTWVSCTTRNDRPGAFLETEDTANLEVGFASGFSLQLNLTWAAARRETAYSLSGTQQTLVAVNDRITISDCTSSSFVDLPSQFDDPSHKTWFPAMLKDFVKATQDRRRQRELLVEAWNSCATVDAAYASARNSGCAIQVAPFPASTHK